MFVTCLPMTLSVFSFPSILRLGGGPLSLSLIQDFAHSTQGWPQSLTPPNPVPTLSLPLFLSPSVGARSPHIPDSGHCFVSMPLIPLRHQSDLTSGNPKDTSGEPAFVFSRLPHATVHLSWAFSTTLEVTVLPRYLLTGGGWLPSPTMSFLLALMPHFMSSQDRSPDKPHLKTWN